MAKIDFTPENCDTIKETANNYVKKLVNQGELYKKLSETLEECWTGPNGKQNIERLSENSKELINLAEDLSAVNTCVNLFLDDLKSDFSQ